MELQIKRSFSDLAIMNTIKCRKLQHLITQGKIMGRSDATDMAHRFLKISFIFYVEFSFIRPFDSRQSSIAVSFFKLCSVVALQTMNYNLIQNRKQ